MKMNVTLITVGFSIVSTVFSIGFTVYMMRRLSQDIGSVMSGLLDEVSATQMTIDAELPNIKKYYSYIGSQGNQTRQENIANRYVDEAIIEQAIGINPEVITEVLSDFSPRLAELVNKNPSLITSVMPKIQQYIDMRNGTTENQGQPAAPGAGIPIQTAETDADIKAFHNGSLG